MNERPEFASLRRATEELRQQHAEFKHRHPVNQAHHDDASVGERLADHIAAGIGSWPFLIVQGVLLLGWIGANGLWLAHRSWDPYPFILLNLCLSVQAAYAGPVILLAGNRQAQKDRLTLEHAAAEADKADQQNEDILAAIAENTTHTLAIVQHLGIGTDAIVIRSLADLPEVKEAMPAGCGRSASRRTPWSS